MCALLVGLPEVTVLGVEDRGGEPLRVLVEMSQPRPLCPSCSAPAQVKDRRLVELVDLPVFGRPARLLWRKHRWMCARSSCATGSWTAINVAIAAPRLALTDRAGRWVTVQVGRNGRAVNDVVSSCAAIGTP
jgi:transposase